MADEKLKKIEDLAEQTGSPVDTDLLIVQGSTKTQKITFKTLSDAIKMKLLSWTFDALNTTSKKLIGAINELDSDIGSLKPIATSGLASDVAVSAIQGMTATDVQAALAEQYSKISTLPMFPLSASLGSVEAAADFYDNLSASMPDRTWYRRAASHNVSVPVLGTGVYYTDGVKTSSLYEWQRATSYGNGSPRSFIRSKYNGTWGDWERAAGPSDLNNLADLVNRLTPISIRNVSIAAFLASEAAKAATFGIIAFYGNPDKPPNMDGGYIIYMRSSLVSSSLLVMAFSYNGLKRCTGSASTTQIVWNDPS